MPTTAQERLLRIQTAVQDLFADTRRQQMQSLDTTYADEATQGAEQTEKRNLTIAVAGFGLFWSERPADLILNLLWRSTAEWNETHYQNPKFDQLLDEARRELDFEARRNLYQQSQQILVEDGGNLIPFYVNLTHVYSAHVSGISPVSYREFNWETITKSE